MNEFKILTDKEIDRLEAFLAGGSVSIEQLDRMSLTELYNFMLKVENKRKGKR